jgi:hypothetical protein
MVPVRSITSKEIPRKFIHNTKWTKRIKTYQLGFIEPTPVPKIELQINNIEDEESIRPSDIEDF